MKNICGEIENITKTSDSVIAYVKKIKKWTQDIMKKQKITNKLEKSNNEKKIPSVHVKKNISCELLNFMNKHKKNGSKYKLASRTEVLREICNYIKINNLQTKEDKRFFVPNNVLVELLKMNPNNKYLFFSLNKYLSVHFTK